MKVGIVDYERGNLRSVEKAFARIGQTVSLLNCGLDLRKATPDLLVLPGVGAFGDAMSRLEEKDWVGALRDWLAEDRPFLGICLGYQLLFSASEESPEVPGLGVFPEKVVRFPTSVGRVPHMGWNRVRWEGSEANSPLNSAFAGDPYFYFVHSFFPETVKDCEARCMTDYGQPFMSGVIRGRCVGFQFHPEKSQAAGLALLQSTCERAEETKLIG